MILDTTTKSLEVFLGEGISANELDVVAAAWGDYTSSGLLPGSGATVTNGVTAVTAVAAPAAGVQRLVQELRVHNNDTIPHTVFVQLNDNSTLYILDSGAVDPGGNFTYTPGKVASGASGNTVQSSAVLVGAAVSLTTGTPLDVTTLVLPAGSWAIYGSVYFTGAAGTTITRVAGSLSLVLNTLGTAPGAFSDQYLAAATLTTIGADVSVTGLGIVDLAGDATYHLVAKADFAVSTLSGYGLIFAVPVS